MSKPKKDNRVSLVTVLFLVSLFHDIHILKILTFSHSQKLMQSTVYVLFQCLDVNTSTRKLMQLKIM